MTGNRTIASRAIVFLLPILLLAACSSAGSTAPAAPAPTVADAWVRPPMGPGQPAAGYMTITAAAAGADALVGASSPVAGAVEIHETSTDASGMMGMHPVDRIPLAPGASVALEPGGYHLMLMDLTGELDAGGTVELVLEFETAGKITVQAAIRDE